MKGSTVGVLLGLFAVVGGQVGQDLMTWSDWSQTFNPHSVGRLLYLMAMAIASYQAGKAVQGSQNQASGGSQ